MVDDKNQVLANKAIEDYKNYIDKAESKIETLLNNNQNTDNQAQHHTLLLQPPLQLKHLL